MLLPPGATPEQASQVFDIGNDGLAKVPVNLTVGQMDTSDGQLAVLTWRSAACTFTALATPDELQTWINLQTGLHSTMSKAGLTVIRGPMPQNLLGDLRR